MIPNLPPHNLELVARNEYERICGILAAYGPGQPSRRVAEALTCAANAWSEVAAAERDRKLTR